MPACTSLAQELEAIQLAEDGVCQRDRISVQAKL